MTRSVQPDLAFETTLVRGRIYGLDHAGRTMWFKMNEPVRVSVEVAARLERVTDPETIMDETAPQGVRLVEQPRFHVRQVKHAPPESMPV